MAVAIAFALSGRVARRLCAALLIAAQLLLPLRAAAQPQVLPSMGDGNEMTATEERRLGDSIARELYRDPDYVDDPVVYEYVQQVWQRLLAAARLRGEITPELDERFAWVILMGRDPAINAFALPGGYMGLNMGLVAVVGSRDELATVLGHEMSHITQRHISRMMAAQSKQTPWMLAGMILGIIAAAKSNSGDAGSAMIMGSQAYMMQSQLSFSRDMEREADRIGFGVMTQAGYAPQGAASMFEKLQYASRLNDNGSYPYLRSHPLTSERIADMQSRFQLTPGTATKLPLLMDQAMISARARVLTRPGVDALRLWIESASGPDFARASPAQQAGTLYAAALASSEMHDHKTARALAQRLIARSAGDASAARLARLLSAEIELAAGAPAAAGALVDAKSKERPELMLAAQVAIATREPVPMVPTLRDWVAAHPRDATAWRALASLYEEQGNPVASISADAEANVAILDYAAARDRFRAAQDLVRKGTVRIDDYDPRHPRSRRRPAVPGAGRGRQADEALSVPADGPVARMPGHPVAQPLIKPCG
jgi:predicted Zn-dependent protease